jgi:hypothetical protein
MARCFVRLPACAQMAGDYQYGKKCDVVEIVFKIKI